LSERSESGLNCKQPFSHKLKPALKFKLKLSKRSKDVHATAMNNCKMFFETYSSAFEASASIKIIEIGSQDVNGSLRQVCPMNANYIGVDFQNAKGVDVVLADPYALPFDSESVDVVISSSCFEHSEMFWLIFLEALRILKPKGLFYLNAPSTGDFHRYPVDCWRFYPDSGKALVTWAKRNGINAAILESYTQKGGVWQDFVGVFLKDEACLSDFPNRILNIKRDYENGQVYGAEEVLNICGPSQNDKKLQAIGQIVSEQIVIN
jgi:SAM-dependent methyltransferase